MRGLPLAQRRTTQGTAGAKCDHRLGMRCADDAFVAAPMSRSAQAARSDPYARRDRCVTGGDAHYDTVNATRRLPRAMHSRRSHRAKGRCLAGDHVRCRLAQRGHRCHCASRPKGMDKAQRLSKALAGREPDVPAQDAHRQLSRGTHVRLPGDRSSVSRRRSTARRALARPEPLTSPDFKITRPPSSSNLDLCTTPARDKRTDSSPSNLLCRKVLVARLPCHRAQRQFFRHCAETSVREFRVSRARGPAGVSGPDMSLLP